MKEERKKLENNKCSVLTVDYLIVSMLLNQETVCYESIVVSYLKSTAKRNKSLSNLSEKVSAV